MAGRNPQPAQHPNPQSAVGFLVIHKHNPQPRKGAPSCSPGRAHLPTPARSADAMGCRGWRGQRCHHGHSCRPQLPHDGGLRHRERERNAQGLRVLLGVLHWTVCQRAALLGRGHGCSTKTSADCSQCRVAECTCGRPQGSGIARRLRAAALRVTCQASRRLGSCTAKAVARADRAMVARAVGARTWACATLCTVSRAGLRY